MKFEVLNKAPILHENVMAEFVCREQRDADHQFYQLVHQEIIREILGRINFVFVNNEGMSEEEWQAVREIITEKYLGVPA